MQRFTIGSACLLAGYGLTFVFPQKVEVEKQVEIPIEKRIEVIVEKPVEKIVERRIEIPVTKIVEVPAKLSAEQELMIAEGSLANAARTLNGTPGMFGTTQRTVKVIVDISEPVRSKVNEDAIKARVETTFRNCGFKIIDEGSADTIIHVQAQMLLAKVAGREIGLSGALSISVDQYVTAKLGWHVAPTAPFEGKYKLMACTMKRYGSTVTINPANYDKIPSMLDDDAITAANDLVKACERDEALAKGR